MAAPYRDISRAAYVMAADAAPLTADYRALAFPEHWHHSVLALCNRGRPQEWEPYRTVPTYRMDGVLQSLAPDLIVRGRPREGQRQAGDFWLYVPASAPSPFPGDTFDRLVGAWLRDLRPEPDDRRDVLATLSELRAAPPLWEDITLDLLRSPCTDGGTAAPLGYQYQLTSDAIARRILALDPYDTGAGTLRFRAAPRGPRQQGAELISQPLEHVVKGQAWWFSILINISLHTVPFDPRPRLHLHTGVRRWATRIDPGTGQIRLPYTRDTSVYLSPTVPWLPGAPASDRYAVARLTRDRRTQRYGWKYNGPAQILSNLALSQPFPHPEELLAAPQNWIGDGPGVRAAVIYSTHLGSHGIGPGLMSHQRSKITEWAEQALPAGMRRVPRLTRATAGPSTPANPRPAPQGSAAKEAESTRAARDRRIALAAAARLSAGEQPAVIAATLNGTDTLPLPPIVTARLLWQTPALRDAAISALTETLGLEGDGGAPTRALAEEAYDSAQPGSPLVLQWAAPELSIRLRCMRATGGIADTLGISPAARPKGKALEAAIRTRRSALAEFLAADGASPERPELALIEIDRRRDFARPLDDPKFAIRLGCADVGVLTQFVLVPKKARHYNSEKNLDHRVRSGWQDGLRQLGVRVLPEHTIATGIPEGLRYAALWMVKRRKDGPTRLPRHTPVAVMVTPLAPGTGLAAVTGWDPKTAQWISYPQFLLRLVEIAEIPDVIDDDPDDDTPGNDAVPAGPQSGQVPAGSRRQATGRAWRQNMDEQRRDTERYLQKMLRSLRGYPTVLLTHSQNSRMHWPWLQDGQTEQDLIKTGHAPPSHLDPDLRLIRVRGAAGRETPQWWGNAAPGGVNGLPPGMWAETEDAEFTSGRTFYSTTAKAGTFRDSAVEADKLASRPLRAGPNKGEPTIDSHIPAWNPALVEIVVLGCHPEAGDQPEALALAVHQLRQAPDYLDALSMPLPMHLASLAQAYVLPTRAEEAEEAEEDATDTGETATSSAAETSLASVLGIIAETTAEDEADLDHELPDAPGLAQAPEESASPREGQLAISGIRSSSP
jgi:pPIWI_RE module N-terminal domain/RNaseH domain of pPIWI_RE/MID domain of pPIWI_RE